MKIISISNQKGGSAKTTTCVCLAGALGEKKKKVLVIDLDPQANASTWLGIPLNSEEKGVYSPLCENASLKSVLKSTNTPNVSLIPSSKWLYGADKALSNEVGAETILRERLKKLPNNWDYVLIDTPPALGILTINAFTASNGIIIPVTAQILGLNGLAQSLEAIEMTKERLNSKLCLKGIIVCRFDKRTSHSKEIEKELRTRFPKKVFKTVIRENVRIAESPSFCQPITQYDKSSNGSKDYKALINEIIKM